MNETMLVDAPADELASAAGDIMISDDAPPALAGSTAILVLGMHRSGTSALNGVLRHLGVVLGGNMMPATTDNPRGYWEHAGIVDIHMKAMAAYGLAWDDIRPVPPALLRDAAIARDLRAILVREFASAPLWGLKDPRLCRLMPLWLPLLAELGAAPRVILPVRHPADVAASLSVRDGINEFCAAILWLRHVLEAERGSRGLPRAVVQYEDLVAPGGWRPQIERIGAELGLAFPVAEAGAAIEAFLAPELRHHRAGRGRLSGWVAAVYDALVAGAASLSDTCDAVQRELDHAGELFLPVLGQTVTALSDMRTQRQAQDRVVADLSAQLSRAQHEAQELRALAVRAEGEVKALRQPVAAVTRDGTKLVRPPTIEDAYPQWIAARGAAATSRADWVAERVRAWPAVPVLALGMIVPEGGETTVALTLRSLLMQAAGDWVLHAVAEAPMPDAFTAIPRLVWHQGGEGRPIERLNRALLASSAPLIALIDAGDQLAPHALFAMIDALFRHPDWSALYTDEDKIDLQGARSQPHFKPDLNIDLLRSAPYMGALLVVRRELFARIGGFDVHWDGIEEYDLALRLTEHLGAAEFGHVADVLYHRFTDSGRTRRAAADILADLPRLVQMHLDRLGIAATVEAGNPAHTCRIRYRHDGADPLVSIIVPTKNQLSLLKRCVETVLKVTTYENYEIVIVDNGSDETDACEYLDAIEAKLAEIGGRLRVFRHPGAFNYSAMNNRAVREAAQGDYICLLNNDTAPLDGEWLGEMMALARRPDVGAVGAKLYFPDGTIQHGGVVLGVGWGSPADHPYNRDPGTTPGYWGRLLVPQDFSAVTAACMVTRRDLYDAVGGLDETVFAVSFNDVDYCLKLREAGHLVVWTPYAQLLHEAGVSQRATNVEKKAIAEKNARFRRESIAMFDKWMPRIAFDEAYNRNLSSLGLGFSVETESAPTWDPAFRPRERVLVYAADREGCGEYRVIAPSRALFKSGLVHTYQTMRLMTPPEVARMAPESVVFQRQLEWNQIEFIEQVKHLSRAYRVFEMDDLITNLPQQSAHRAQIPADVGDRLKKAVGLCDRLVVSTEPLAGHFRKYSDNIVVSPNRLEKSRWLGLAPRRRRDGKPRVGWAGAVGHTGDLALIASVVEATRKDVDWVFFGMCPDALRPMVAEYHEWVLLIDYAKTLASLDLDLAIAPLAPHPFNECKSNLRLLEYGVLGYPVLCTDILPYQGNLPVFRVRNRPADWIARIRELVADRVALEAAGAKLRQAVLADWLLEDHLDQWRRAWLP
ncbi:MAG TPA: glycosyltransferase [Stellaceae bacterium]|jgi:GT2 family glycosyltransferase